MSLAHLGHPGPHFRTDFRLPSSRMPFPYPKAFTLRTQHVLEVLLQLNTPTPTPTFRLNQGASLLASHCPLPTQHTRVSICRQVLVRQSHLPILSPPFTPGCNAPNCPRSLIQLTKPSQASIPHKPLGSRADPRGPAPALGPLGQPLCLGTVCLPTGPRRSRAQGLQT